MRILLNIGLIIIFLFNNSGCKGQSNREADKVVGGPFENGEFMYIGMPEHIDAVDTSAGWNQNGQKLFITGTIFERDGKTPAPNVILYYYHTDIHGHYSTRKGLDKRVARHGYIRGWVKSDKDGRYAIYTVRPAPYPNRNEPAHIHPSIKEPDIDKEYYIDEFVFDDDKLLTGARRKAMENRGGSGILRVVISGDLQIAEHDIILGLHIPNYPKSVTKTVESGRSIGEDVFSFTPYHAWGPDKATKTCPICKYGRYHGILYFAGNKPDWIAIKRWLSYLEKESVKREKYLKAYFIYNNDDDLAQEKRIKQLEKIGKELKLKNIALTFVPSFDDKKSDVYLNQINPEVNNTFIIYRHVKIVAKFINLEPTKKNFELISQRLDATKGEFFNLSDH